MKANEIIKELEIRYPVETAEDWDNPGLLVGDDRREIKKVYLVLDVTLEAIEAAKDWGADMIISHHPMIFSSLKRINNHDFLGKKILKLLQNNMVYYAIHTNFDVCKMAEINASLLGLENPEVLCVTGEFRGEKAGIGRVGLLPRMTLEQCAELVKEKYRLPHVQVYGELKSTVERAAVSGGSGKSMVDVAVDAGAQVLITGDIDHHTGLDAVDKGIAVIDAGHYGTEYFFMEQVYRDMAEIKGGLQVKSAPVVLPCRLIL